MDLKHELERASKREVISLGALHDIINEETVEAYFLHNGTPLRPANLHEIVSKAPRLFAIHVLLNRGCDVMKYLSRGLSDKDLPFLEMPECPEFGSPQEQRSLHQRQWQIASTLDPSEHRAFPAQFKPPFAFKASCPKDRGAFGHVYQVRMADGHLPGYSFNQLLALKQVRVDPPVKREEVMREMQTLRARRHDCIVPLIASWTTEVLESEVEVLQLNLLFPHAQMNLKEWLYLCEDPPEWKDRRPWQLKDYIYRSILSISSAVVFVHREIEGFISSHHDIKPANILLFDQTWKLADFGRSHLLPWTKASDTDGILGTYAYQPPEYRDSLGRKAEKRHGRAFDVWSLACIIIELLTVAVYGWKGQKLSQFHRKRIDNRSHPKRVPRERQNRDNSFFNNMNVVQDWTRQLLRDDGSPNLRSMLTIVKTMMYEEESHRYLSWEVHLDLYELLHPIGIIEERETETEATVQQPNAHHGKREHNPLRRAAEQKNMPRIKWLLKRGWAGHPLDLPKIDTKDSSDIVMWIRTARAMQGLKWRRLVRKTIRNTVCNSPSMAASARASGLSPNQPPDLSSSKEISSAVEKEISSAVEKEISSAVEKALASSGSSTALKKGSVEQDENGMTKIHHECKKPHYWKVVRHLQKISPQKWDSIIAHEDSVGRLPLHYAAENGSSQIIEYLLENFSLQSAALAAWRDHGGRTPLHLASQQGDIGAIKTLLQAHMDQVTYAKVKDNQTKTAWDLARDNGHEDACELLEEIENPVRKQMRLATGLR